jgi:hypothetical protein
MRKWLFVFLIAGFPLTASAQLVPHVALFGGYTWVRSEFNGINNPGFSLNGWDASLEVKPIPLVGLVADVSRQYASPNGINENQTMALFGPQVSVPGFKRVIPYAHAMAGVIHGTTQQPGGCIAVVGVTCPPFLTGNAFATAVGGGVDFKLGGPIWIRAIQADWLHANLNPDHHTQVRLATGIVIRFGK